ncbi:MAG: L-seryl-tRNA(Sec) selenium transferase [Deltaproteobacteria bacterium]|nr:L-seryl-tRNA(Sec) selenium transferase [Deltaproteobacteria bacterium]
MSDNLKGLPAVDQVLDALEASKGETAQSRRVLTAAVRDVIAGLRKRIRAGDAVAKAETSAKAVARQASALAQRRRQGSLRPVINLTGVIIHTNLGRAPMSPSVMKAVERRMTSYSNLEYDLDQHKRGSRYDHVSEMLLQLVPGEAALVVNNNAAAVLLILTEFAAGGECVVSRGELIEIGGGFRIPDVMVQSGARLVEVGTTNKTRLQDYEQAVGPDTSMIFKAHHSNFRMVGFTEETSYAELAELAAGKGIIFTADIGSGLLAELDAEVAAGEPTPAQVIASGADLVCFSGDKLLGGPQAGVIVGKSDLVARLKKNPLLRALRVGKFTIASMEATLGRYLEGGFGDIPILSAVLADPKEVLRRCRRVAARVRRLQPHEGLTLRVVRTAAEVGGGTLPGRTIPSFGIEVELKGMSETSLEEMLRGNDPPVLGRLAGGRLVLDLRTMMPGQEVEIAGALARLKPGDGQNG